MFRTAFLLNLLICLLYPTAASAWGYKGHRVVGSIAVSGDAKGRVDPDAMHQIDPGSETAGGNRISVRDQCLVNANNQCINFHAEWDENPKNLDDAATRGC